MSITSSLVAPWNSITFCDNQSAAAACGVAIAGRTNWNNDWCALRTQLLDLQANSTFSLLAGRTLSIAVLPSYEPDFKVQAGPPTRLTGLLAEYFKDVALTGGFTWDVYVIRGPAADYGHAWHPFMLDWTNRVDVLGCWFYATPFRRLNVGFPHPFHDQSPVLVAREVQKERSNLGSESH